MQSFEDVLVPKTSMYFWSNCILFPQECDKLREYFTTSFAFLFHF